MKRTYRIGIDGSGASEMLKGVLEFQKMIEQKTQELCQRCASIGLEVASLNYSQADYMGNNDTTVTVVPVKNGYAVRANGEAVMFLEFGAGYLMGYGHPEAGEFGMGPGTWPPADPDHPHWNDARGWYLPRWKGGGHTYGNSPSMAMYRARKEIEQNIKQIVTEVFGSAS